LLEVLSLGNSVTSVERIHALEMLASALGMLGRSEEAAGLFGVAEAARVDLGAPLPAHELATHQSDLELVRAALGSETFEACFRGGHDTSLDDATRSVLESTSSHRDA
jgi:hypothetical protein